MKNYKTRNHNPYYITNSIAPAQLKTGAIYCKPFNTHLMKTSTLSSFTDNLKAIFCFLILSLSLQSFAQPSYRIEGKLYNLAENKPVEFASIALHRLPDSTLITGAVSDTSGKFSLSNLKEGKYFIKVSCLGFQPLKKSDLILSPTEPALNVGTIEMNTSSQTLKEVVVEGERLKGVTEVDKTVYTINNKIAASSHTGLELMRQVPAVQVDFQNNITLEGSSNIMILVDGKQRDKNYLAQLDPNSIDKIEVMTNPSVKYDADITGVINIILKREKKVGISGQLSPEIPLTTKAFFSSSNGNIEYGYNKVRVFVSGYSHLENFDMTNTVDRLSTANGSTFKYYQKGDGKVDVNFTGLDYGVDYFFNKNNTLNLYGNYRPGNGLTFKTNGYKELYNNDVLNTFISGNNYNKNVNTSEYYSAFYKRTFEKPSQEFTLDLNYYKYHGDGESKYTEQYYLGDKTTTVGELINRSELNNNYKQAVGMKVDYVQPLTKDSRLSGGYHFYTQWFNNDFSGASDATERNLKYDETRHAGYLSYSGVIKTISVQTGLRYEMSLIDIKNKIKTDYSCWLPQLTLQKKLGKTQSLKLTYRRSIQRPGIDQLNPFVTYTDSVTISRGNPYLKPSYSNKAELNYSVPVKNSFISTGIYYNYFTDNFQQVTHIIDGRITENFIDNIGTGAEYGANLSGSIKINKWFMINPYICLYNVQLDGISTYGIESKNKLSMRSNATFIFSLPKKFTVFVFTQYNSPYISAQNLNKRDPLYVIGFEKEINKNFKASFTALNPFMRKFVVSNSITESENFWQENKIDVLLRNLMTVRITYTFKYGSKINKLERQKEVETDGKNSIF